MVGMPGMPMQAPPNLAMPQPQYAPQPPGPYPQYTLQPQAPQPPLNQWQAGPPPQTLPLAQIASGVLPAQPAQPAPIKARGVAPDPGPRKFVLPSPEELGVVTRPNAVTPTAPQPASAPIDWNQVHARMDRLGVLRQERSRLASGAVRVLLLLPTRDPAVGQPVEAIAETEAAAIALALDRAEAWLATR